MLATQALLTALLPVIWPDTLRLSGGKWNGEGRVEIYNNGAWGTVCHYSWDIRDALVVCHQLGFPDVLSAPRYARFGPGKGSIWLNYVNCRGTESSIESCPHSGWSDHNSECHHSYDSSVICVGKYNASALLHRNNFLNWVPVCWRLRLNNKAIRLATLFESYSSLLAHFRKIEIAASKIARLIQNFKGSMYWWSKPLERRLARFS